MTSINSSYYFYLQNNELKKDFDTRSPSCLRGFKSYFLNRNYNILDILKHSMTDAEFDLSEREIELVAKCSSNILKVSTNAIKNFIELHQFIARHNEEDEIDEKSFELLGQGIASLKSSEIKKLKAFQNQVDQEQQRALPALENYLSKAYYKAKWTELGLKPEIADACPLDVAFLVETRLIYSILGLQNSTENGKTEHGIRCWGNLDTPIMGLEIKKEGQWEKISTIMEELVYDLKEGMLTSCDNLHEHWNYFAEGLMPVDRFHHHYRAKFSDYPEKNKYLQPVTKLSSEELQILLKTALLNPQPGQTEENLTAVVQFVSHPRPLFKSSILKNFNSQFPVHCGIRIITNNGEVYSTGFGSTSDEDSYNTGPWRFLGSINGQPTNIDYEEFRVHQGRITTSLAITKENAETILDKLNEYRKQGIRFNILKQNCMKLGTNILSYCGYSLDIKLSLESMLFRCLPNLEQIPMVGPKLKEAYKWSCEFTDKVSSKIPSIVKNIFQYLAYVALFLPRKTLTVLKNILIYSLGGTIGSPLLSSDQMEEDIDEDNALQDFTCLLGSLFDDHASDINHSSIFINWQLNQPSTQVLPYDLQPSMSILPIQSEKAIGFSKNKLAEFKDLYRFSLPA